MHMHKLQHPHIYPPHLMEHICTCTFTQTHTHQVERHLSVAQFPGRRCRAGRYQMRLFRVHISPRFLFHTSFAGGWNGARSDAVGLVGLVGYIDLWGFMRDKAWQSQGAKEVCDALTGPGDISRLGGVYPNACAHADAFCARMGVRGCTRVCLNKFC